jgi:exosortase/archaeosortase family protein
MKQKFKLLLDSLQNNKEILLFLFLLFLFHFSWKIAIDGDREGDIMYFFGRDITPGWFNTLNGWLVSAVAWFIRLFPDTQNLIVEGRLIYFPEEHSGISKIVWGCTGIKQLFIFTGIMLFYRGPFAKKSWYIPMGWILLTAYNIARIGLIVLLTREHAERFETLHDGLFRYLYYTIVFLLWVVWEETIVNKNNHLWQSFIRIFKP